MERTLPLQQIGGLGVCKQTTPWSEANLGPGDTANVYSSRRTEGRNSEAIWMAHFPAHVFDFATQRRDRIQSDAGVVAALLLPVNVGCLHAGNFARKARCAGAVLGSGVRR